MLEISQGLIVTHLIIKIKAHMIHVEEQVKRKLRITDMVYVHYTSGFNSLIRSGA